MIGKAKPEETWTRERCFISELLNSDAHPDVSIARARVEPGVTTELHSLSVYEWYVIESGRGQMRIGDDEPFLVEPGDTVSIPKYCAQQITNRGSDDLLFVCVCAPRFLQESYTPLE